MEIPVTLCTGLAVVAPWAAQPPCTHCSSSWVKLPARPSVYMIFQLWTCLHDFLNTLIFQTYDFPNFGPVHMIFHDTLDSVCMIFQTLDLSP